MVWFLVTILYVCMCVCVCVCVYIYMHLHVLCCGEYIRRATRVDVEGSGVVMASIVLRMREALFPNGNS